MVFLSPKWGGQQGGRRRGENQNETKPQQNSLGTPPWSGLHVLLVLRALKDKEAASLGSLTQSSFYRIPVAGG